MLLTSLLAKLPTSILIASLALAASAVPVESVELRVLTPDNFDSTVAEGAWFIEHFSPYCTHCRAFKPTWEKLVQHYESMDDPGVHLAQVNCAANGDLCNKHSVTGYPQMNMYKDGKMAQQFKGARDWDALISFIDGHAIHEPAKKVETQAEPPAQKVETHSQKLAPNPEGMVKALDASTFAATLEEGAVFVKFYAPWCGHCKKLAPVWTQLAAQMRHKLNVAEVNCEVHKDVCKAQGVQGYPALMFYSGGSGSDVHKTEYTGGRKFDQLKRFAEMAVAPAVVEVESEADYEHYVKESPVLYLLLYSPDDKLALKQLTKASRVLLGSPKILTSSNPELRKRFSIPASFASSPVILAIKDGIAHGYTSFLPLTHSSSQSASPTKINELEEWLIHNRVPSSLALHQETFQEVMSAPHHPLVVIAAISPSQEHHAAEVIRSTAREWRHLLDRQHATLDSPARDVVFTWMDAEKWASWMKSMYGIKSADEATVIITDHHKLIYYDSNAKGGKITLETQSITDAVKDVLAGRVAYKNSENIIERIARRLNDMLTYLEEAVVANPIRSALALIGFLCVLFMAIKRLVSEEGPSYTDYTRLQKDTNRLD